MTDEHGFAPVLAAAKAFQGYGIERLSLSVAEAGDAVEIIFLPFSGLPWMSLSLWEIHYFALDRVPREEMTFFDWAVQVLSPHEPWPAGLPSRREAGDGAPWQLWLHADGPTGAFDVVATVAQMFTEFGR